MISQCLSATNRRPRWFTNRRLQRRRSLETGARGAGTGARGAGAGTMGGGKGARGASGGAPQCLRSRTSGRRFRSRRPFMSSPSPGSRMGQGRGRRDGGRRRAVAIHRRYMVLSRLAAPRRRGHSLTGCWRGRSKLAVQGTGRWGQGQGQAVVVRGERELHPNLTVETHTPESTFHPLQSRGRSTSNRCRATCIRGRGTGSRGNSTHQNNSTMESMQRAMQTELAAHRTKAGASLEGCLLNLHREAEVGARCTKAAAFLGGGCRGRLPIQSRPGEGAASRMAAGRRPPRLPCRASWKRGRRRRRRRGTVVKEAVTRAHRAMQWQARAFLLPARRVACLWRRARRWQAGVLPLLLLPVHRADCLLARTKCWQARVLPPPLLLLLPSVHRVGCLPHRCQKSPSEASPSPPQSPAAALQGTLSRRRLLQGRKLPCRCLRGGKLPGRCLRGRKLSGRCL